MAAQISIYDKLFPNPLPLGWVVLFVIAGISAYWSRWGHDRVRVYGLAPLIALLPIKESSRPAIEFMVFAVLGCLVGLAMVRPTNVAQSLTAGFAWTGFFATIQDPDAPHSRKGRKK